MGTSTSQRSPKTSNWNAANAAFTDRRIPLTRAVQEVWRAATNQPEGNLARDLASTLVADCLRIAAHTPARDEAIREATLAVALSGEASLAADIARRALARSYRMQDRVAEFTSSLFAEAADYLVSRDLPGFVGPNARATSAKDAISLKKEMREIVSREVEHVPRPRSAQDLASDWDTYVSAVVARLRGDR